MISYETLPMVGLSCDSKLLQSLVQLTNKLAIFSLKSLPLSWCHLLLCAKDEIENKLLLFFTANCQLKSKRYNQWRSHRRGSTPPHDPSDQKNWICLVINKICECSVEIWLFFQEHCTILRACKLHFSDNFCSTKFFSPITTPPPLINDKSLATRLVMTHLTSVLKQ